MHGAMAEQLLFRECNDGRAAQYDRRRGEFHKRAGTIFALYLFVHTNLSQKAGLLSVARSTENGPTRYLSAVVSRTTAFTGEVPALFAARPTHSSQSSPLELQQCTISLLCVEHGGSFRIRSTLRLRPSPDPSECSDSQVHSIQGVRRVARPHVQD